MYLELAEAAEYFEGRMYSGSWTDASLSDRTTALIHASRILDTLAYRGTKVSAEQEHQFPRIINEITQTEIPNDLKNACCEIALALLNGIDPEKEAESLSVTSSSFSSVRSTYDRGFAQMHVTAGIPSRVAWSYITPYLRDLRRVKIVRG